VGELSKRKAPSVEQKNRLLTQNANRCCVCKRGGVGLHLHHIDEDPSNTVDENLAVLCVQDHDLHHRPTAYNLVKHINLGKERIKNCKNSWEDFLAEATQNDPKILATVSVYGNYEHIHAAQLVIQRLNEEIEYERVFHLFEGGYEYWAEEIVREVHELGANIKIAFVNEPLPVDHCPCCGKGYSRTIKKGFALKMASPNWSTYSVCSIYINPNQPSLALTVFLKDELIYQGNLHLCRGTHLHYSCDYYDESIKVKRQPSVRTQASAIVQKVINTWEPNTLFIGTGEHEEPYLINDFKLPRCWENRES
jgi:hypothetical protein